jgi:hypothetical protein
MVNEDHGFSVKQPRSKDEAELKGVSFYYDPIHPDGNTGARRAGGEGARVRAAAALGVGGLVATCVQGVLGQRLPLAQGCAGPAPPPADPWLGPAARSAG